MSEEILRSTFITCLAPAPTVAEARAFMARKRAEFGDATHNCWAYLVGAPGSTGQVGMSDDGEPHGTAGRPMLNVLNHSKVGDIACVITRYYGGTKLGKGGLVRAYSGGVKLALKSLPLCEKIDYQQLCLVLPYSFITVARKILSRLEVVIVTEDYASDVTYRLDVPCDVLDDFILEIDNITAGESLWDLAAN